MYNFSWNKFETQLDNSSRSKQTTDRFGKILNYFSNAPLQKRIEFVIKYSGELAYQYKQTSSASFHSYSNEWDFQNIVEFRVVSENESYYLQSRIPPCPLKNSPHFRPSINVINHQLYGNLYSQEEIEDPQNNILEKIKFDFPIKSKKVEFRLRQIPLNFQYLPNVDDLNTNTQLTEKQWINYTSYIHDLWMLFHMCLYRYHHNKVIDLSNKSDLFHHYHNFRWICFIDNKQLPKEIKLWTLEKAGRPFFWFDIPTKSEATKLKFQLLDHHSNVIFTTKEYDI
jgi:hypothetical protein